MRRERYKAAAQLLGYLHQVYEQHAMGMFGPTWAGLEAIGRELKDRLGEARVEELVREGRGIGDGAAVELACGE